MWKCIAVNLMNKFVELPLAPPIYSTYHFQGPASAVLVSNPSIRNWYRNEVMILSCTNHFLSGFTTPQLSIEGSGWLDNPYLEKHTYPLQFLKGYIHPVIRNLIDAGYYVCFMGVDDYYIDGKSWYKERHFNHDGAICGYNQEDKTYCIYAYDDHWVYRKFWTPQKSFEKGIKSAIKSGLYGEICGIKPTTDTVTFDADVACRKIAEYLDSSLEKYPEETRGVVYGIAVQDYIVKYVGCLKDGFIPYERMDRRIFRLLWEHKKAMLERIQYIENAFCLKADISKRYALLTAEADTMRMLYASHHMKRRDSVLPILQKKLSSINKKERELLMKLLEKTEGSKKT